MLCFPQSLMGLKAGILAILLIASIYKTFTLSEQTYLPKYLYWILFFFLSGLFSLTYGVVKGNPGAHFFLLTYLVWPLVFPLIFKLLDNNSFRSLFGLFKFSYVILLITGAIAFLQMNLGVFSFFPPELFGYEIVEYARPMYLFISPSGPATVSFFILFSFLLSYYCLDNKKMSIKRVLFLLMGFVYIIITSRRVMMFGFIYIPILFILLSILSKRHNIFPIYNKFKIRNTLIVYIFPIICLIFGIGYIFADMSDFSLFFSSAFSSDGDFGSGENVRLDQRVALLNGWYDNFFFGAGTGINASVVRNDIPGVYELSYYASLFERGLFNGFFYLFLLFIPVVWTVRLARKCIYGDNYIFMLSYAVSYISLLFANATNPYMGSFDFMWVIFMFIALLNIVERKIIYEAKSLCDYKGI